MAEKSTTNDPIEDLRAFMMETADSYAFHPWTAEDKHIRHDDIVDTPDRQTHYNWTPIRTPRGEEPAWHGWAVRGAHGELIKNYGVPYFWGGHAALDPSRDFMYSGELTFDDVLAEGWGGKDDAGDISTVDNLTIRWRNGSGVDCSGFVAQVWRLGNYFNTGGVKDLSLPIRFVDLEAGDLLFKGRHVMLFKEFSTPEKAIPGVTRIKVYESAVYCARVTMSEYLLTKVEEAEAYMKTWNGFENIPSDKVKLKRIATYYRS